MHQNLPNTVCGAQRIPYLLTAGILDTDRYYAIWCEAENTTLADKAFSAKPSDVFFHGLLQHHPIDSHFNNFKLNTVIKKSNAESKSKDNRQELKEFFKAYCAY